jgi:hypothetical protein
LNSKLPIDPDSVVERSPKDSQVLWKYVIRPVLIIAFAVPFFLALSTIDNAYFSSTSTNLLAFYQAIVQLDGFLAAGWTAGFFYFWRSITAELGFFDKQLLLVNTKMRKQPKQRFGIGRVGESTAFGEELHVTAGQVFWVSMVALVSIIYSGLAALAGILSTDRIWALHSSVALVFGLLATLLTWNFGRRMTNTIAKLRLWLETSDSADSVE